jgi:hypothetical protein
MPTPAHPLSDTIVRLRKTGELILLTNGVQTDDDDEQKLAVFLEKEYEREQLHWPHTPPHWCAEAGLWAAKIVFHTARLVLYRRQTIEEIRHLFTHYTGPVTAGAILSADICLRFLPQCIEPLTSLDDTDELIGILQSLLTKWHYSAIGYTDIPSLSDFTVIQSDACLSQLYTDKVIAHKHRAIALHPQIKPLVAAALGQHAATLWPDFYLETTINGTHSVAQ